MKTIFYKKFILGGILAGGLVVGIFRGQEARQKWVSRKKIKCETKRGDPRKKDADQSLVVLDDYEMLAYHS